MEKRSRRRYPWSGDQTGLSGPFAEWDRMRADIHDGQESKFAIRTL